MTASRPWSCLACVLLTLPAGHAVANEWRQVIIQDPVDGRSCAVAVPLGVDAHVYEWPEKFDQVFFPITADAGVWSCASGFVSLIGDHQLSALERDRIAAYLARLPGAERQRADIASRLLRAEALYALRQLDADRRALIHRVLAYDFESLASDAVRASSHRRAALRIMLARLADETLEAGRRMEYLFVSSNYLREAGERERADRLLEQLEAEIALHADDDLATYARYLASSIPAARRVAPGGSLAP